MYTIKTLYGEIASDISPETDLIHKSLEYYGEWAGNELKLLSYFINPGDTVLDIGSYIGTHILAFAKFCTESGKVIGFEPQEHLYSCILETIRINKLNNVTVNNFALADKHDYYEKNSSYQECDNGGAFSLRNSHSVNEDINTANTLEVKTLDSLNIDKIDFIKIDVEGFESKVLNGGTKTIIKNQPIIFCECNEVNSSQRVLDWANSIGYKIISVRIKAYNKNNFFNNDNDFFDNASETSLILFPVEKQHLIKLATSNYQARSIQSIEDIFLTLLTKKQYLKEESYLLSDRININPDDFRLNEDCTNHINYITQQDELVTDYIIAIPFYKQPSLVEPLYNSLLKCADELHNITVCFYNDSPDDVELNEILSKIRDSHDQHVFPLEIITNDKNIGFIHTINKSFSYAREKNTDIVILNSDTILLPGSLKEIQRVAYTDSMIGFVSPRSNNATICTFPHEADKMDLSAEISYSIFLDLKKYLNPVSYVPTCVGFCLYIKNKILSEFGDLDTIYGRGYNEENDYILRANRVGYRAVLANHAFVWHQGEQSFGILNQTKNERDYKNSQILNSRYPEYPILINNYFQSVDYRAEEIFSGLAKNINYFSVAFDFTSLGLYHNGTFEAGKKIIYAADHVWDKEIQIFVICSPEAWAYHAIQSSTSTRVKYIHPSDFSKKFSAVIRLGQPFSKDNLSQIIYRAPITACFMLDTISYDCGYLRKEFDDNIWRYALENLDIIFTNSVFTAKQLIRRFDIGESTSIIPTLHSTDLSEYNSNFKKIELKNQKNILIIGNKFEHKGLSIYIPALSKRYPKIDFTVLGSKEFIAPNITNINTGDLTDEEMTAIYDSCDAIIFPSFYEGFGFPILHSLAHKKPIFIRNLNLYNEIIYKLSSGANNIYKFSSLNDLCSHLDKSIPQWIGGDPRGERNGWARSAIEILNALKYKENNISISNVTKRMRRFELEFTSHPSLDLSVEANISRKITNIIEIKIKKILKNPTAYKTTRLLWRMIKFIRNRKA